MDAAAYQSDIMQGYSRGNYLWAKVLKSFTIRKNPRALSIAISEQTLKIAAISIASKVCLIDEPRRPNCSG